MNTDNNRLALEVIGSPQAADNKQTIGAKAVAYIEENGVTTYPDPVEVVFELPKGSGAVFTDTLTETTSRLTLQDSGRIDPTVPVQFKSKNGIDGGMLKAYWKTDPDNTLQQKTFTFTPVSKGNNVYLQAVDGTYASIEDVKDANVTAVVCYKTIPDATCQFVMVPNGDQTVCFFPNDGSGRCWAMDGEQRIYGVDRTIIVDGANQYRFTVNYQNGGSTMTIVWGDEYHLSLVSGEKNVIAGKWGQDSYCNFTVSYW